MINLLHYCVPIRNSITISATSLALIASIRLEDLNQNGTFPCEPLWINLTPFIDEAPMVCGLVANKFTKHQILIISWNSHYYLKFQCIGQMTKCTW